MGESQDLHNPKQEYTEQVPQDQSAPEATSVDHEVPIPHEVAAQADEAPATTEPTPAGEDSTAPPPDAVSTASPLGVSLAPTVEESATSTVEGSVAPVVDISVAHAVERSAEPDVSNVSVDHLASENPASDHTITEQNASEHVTAENETGQFHDGHAVTGEVDAVAVAEAAAEQVAATAAAAAAAAASVLKADESVNVEPVASTPTSTPAAIQEVVHDGSIAALGSIHEPSVNNPGAKKNPTPFVCEVPGCRKAFGKKFNLKAHTRVHTGEEPFKCSYPTCDKMFKWKSSLTFHEGLHLTSTDDTDTAPPAAQVTPQHHIHDVVNPQISSQIGHAVAIPQVAHLQHNSHVQHVHDMTDGTQNTDNVESTVEVNKFAVEQDREVSEPPAKRAKA